MTGMMVFSKWLLPCVCLAVAISSTSCKDDSKSPQTTAESTNSPSTSQPNTSSPAEIEKVKPQPGTGNVQGKVLYNSKPVSNIEVKLCEKFSRFASGCGGKIYTARTDKNGEYVITKVTPKVYEALLARVFDTNSYVFATSGIGSISSTKYEIAADKTLFASSTNIFKSDLKLTSPKAGATVSTQNLELKWVAYPEAAYYKFSIYSEDTKNISSPYIDERIDGTAFTLTKPLQKGTYRWQVNAYNNADQRLAESDDNIKFTIKQ